LPLNEKYVLTSGFHMPLASAGGQMVVGLLSLFE